MSALLHSRSLVRRYAAGVGLGGGIPLPGVSMAVTAAEVKLVTDIARAYGEPVTEADALRLIALSSAKNVGVKAMGELAAAVPVVGWFARPALFAASVRAVGEAAIRHYEAKRPNEPLHLG